eukprot:gene14984-biopygen2132
MPRRPGWRGGGRSSLSPRLRVFPNFRKPCPGGGGLGGASRPRTRTRGLDAQMIRVGAGSSLAFQRVTPLPSPPPPPPWRRNDDTIVARNPCSGARNSAPGRGTLDPGHGYRAPGTWNSCPGFFCAFPPEWAKSSTGVLSSEPRCNPPRARSGRKKYTGGCRE